MDNDSLKLVIDLDVRHALRAQVRSANIMWAQLRAIINCVCASLDFRLSAAQGFTRAAGAVRGHQVHDSYIGVNTLSA